MPSSSSLKSFQFSTAAPWGQNTGWLQLLALRFESAPALDDDLAGPGKGQLRGRCVLRDGRSRADGSAFTDGDWRNQDAPGADVGPRSDGGWLRSHAVVIAGDGPGAN